MHIVQTVAIAKYEIGGNSSNNPNLNIRLPLTAPAYQSKHCCQLQELMKV